jgi:hypothetical protein
VLWFFSETAKAQPEVWKELVVDYGIGNMLVDLLMVALVMVITFAVFAAIIGVACYFAPADDPLFGDNNHRRGGGSRGRSYGRRRF